MRRSYVNCSIKLFCVQNIYDNNLFVSFFDLSDEAKHLRISDQAAKGY